MKLIISEKAIAGKRIAQLLAEDKVQVEKTNKSQCFTFDKDKEEHVIVPLKGHIMDVNFPQKYSYWVGTDLLQLIDAPIDYYGTENDIIKLLKKKAKKASEVVIATDADREGEAIGAEAIRFIQEVKPKIKIERAYFSAITPKDIKRAFSKLEKVDFNLADSADARREIDLVWGAVLTRFLSLISGRLGKAFLSAGRVQTPTLALIVNREKERQAFEKKAYWVVSALFEKSKQEFEAVHKTNRFWEKDEAEKVMKNKAKEGQVAKVVRGKKTLKRPVPFNTTGLLRAGSSIGFSAGETMRIAENLYTQGIISYPRTDNSTYPATLDLKEILNTLLPNPEFNEGVAAVLAKGALKPSRGKETKDHPPIHPVTNVSKEKLGTKEWRIYELVCRHFIATLSEDALVETLSVTIDLNGEPFVARGQRILTAGWKAVYPYSKVTETFLPELKEGEKVKLNKLNLEEKETQPPARYSQGALIKLMEDQNLGTKSTRHNILQKLYARQYISGIKSIEPNKIGMAVIESLEKHEAQVEKPEMTAKLEEEMDAIASGKRVKGETVTDSRKMLIDVMKKLLEHKNDIGSELRAALREDAVIAQCFACKQGDLRIMHGRTGKRFVGCSNYPKCQTSFPLPQKGKIFTIDKTCPECSKPMVKVLHGRRAFEMCIDHNCKSKDAWKKRAAERAAKQKQTK
jgi:DNA topoisomerase-1